MSSSESRSLLNSQTSSRASAAATWKTARQPALASSVSRSVGDSSESRKRLCVASTNDPPNLPSSESIDS